MFQFNAEYGFLIENGECTTMVRDVSLSGEILQTLHTISLIGNDLALHPDIVVKVDRQFRLPMGRHIFCLTMQ